MRYKHGEQLIGTFKENKSNRTKGGMMDALICIHGPWGDISKYEASVVRRRAEIHKKGNKDKMQVDQISSTDVTQKGARCFRNATHTHALNGIIHAN